MTPLSRLQQGLALFALCLFGQTVIAESMALYVYINDRPAADKLVSINETIYPLDANGTLNKSFATGTHKVNILTNDKTSVFSFSFDQKSDNNTDISVVINEGEKPTVLIDSYSATNDTNDKKPEGYISGEVISNNTGALTGATLALKGTDISATTDTDGYFELDAPRGIYTLLINHPEIGERSINNFRVVAFANKSVNFSFGEAQGDIEEVEVVGKYKANDFVDKERFALNVVDVLDAKAMARFGDSSAGDALKRVAGVSLVGSKYAVIRGLQGRFIATTLNGGAMPSLNPTRRDVALDIFPSSILEGIEIEKSFRPELLGTATGGQINLVTKKPSDEYTQKLTIGTGYTSGVTGKNVVSYDGGSTDIFGYDDGERKLPESIDEATNFGRETPPSSLNLENELSNNYAIKNKKATPDMKLSYSLGNSFEIGDGNLSFYNAVSYNSGWEARREAFIDDREGKFTYKRSTYNADLSGYLALGYQTDNHDVTSKTIYLHQASDTTKVTKGTDKEERESEKYILQWIENTYLSQQFEGKHQLLDGSQELHWFTSFGQTNRYEPDRRSYTILGQLPILSEVNRRFGDMTESAMDFSLNYKINFDLGESITNIAKVGTYISAKDRDAKIGNFGFAVSNDTKAGQTLEEALETPSSLIKKTGINANYTADETLTAAYVSLESNIADTVSLLAGVRMENYEQNLAYPDNSIADNTFDSSDLMPIGSLTWYIDDAWQLRGSISQTVSRPGLTERSTSKFYDPETDDEFYGRPNLEKTDIINMDIRAEYYFDDKNQVSLALFNKILDAPIEIGKFKCSGSACEGYTFGNQKKATILGLELDFDVSLFEMDQWATFAKGNLSYIDAEVTLSDENRSEEFESNDSRQLQGQSDFLANIQLGIDYLTTEQSLSLSGNYFSDRIYRVEKFTPNKIEEGRWKLDLVYQWQINEMFELKAKGSNLFNPATKYKKDNKVTESYYKGTGWDLEISMNF